MITPGTSSASDAGESSGGRLRLERIREAVALLAEAKRPVLIAGGGVHYSEAWSELQAFSDALGIPIGETFAGKGALKEFSPIALGGIGLEGTGTAFELIAAADLVIAVGTRLTDFATGSQSGFRHPDVKFININVCGHDAFKQGALPIVADAKLALGALREAALAGGLRPREDYKAEVARARSDWDAKMRAEVYAERDGEFMSQGQLIGLLNREARAGDTIVAASGGPPGDLLKLWDSSGGRHCHLEFGYSCMGYEIPAGLGVRLAQPSCEVFVLIGDGTYLMNPTELVTAVQEGLKITVIISENHGYQCIRRLQMWRTGVSFGNEFRHRDSGTNRLEGDYLRFDLAANAESFGARAWHVATPEQLAQALLQARAETRTCVIVVEVEKHRVLPGGGCWWDVAPGGSQRGPEDPRPAGRI